MIIKADNNIVNFEISGAEANKIIKTRDKNGEIVIIGTCQVCGTTTRNGIGILSCHGCGR